MDQSAQPQQDSCHNRAHSQSQKQQHNSGQHNPQKYDENRNIHSPAGDMVEFEAQIQQNQDKDKQNKNEDSHLNYYNQFCRLYLTNTILTAQLKQLSVQKNELVSKLTRIEKRAQQLSEGNSGHVDQKKKRVRRSASQIARHYKCQVDGCNKSYGSEGSLNQHLKIKHPELFRALNSPYLGNGIVKQSQQEDQSL